MKNFKFFLIVFFLFLIFPMHAFSAVPNVPSNVTLSSTSQKTIKVTWAGDNEADGYKIYWGLSEDALNQNDTVGSSTRQYTIQNLTPGTLYYVAVSAYNEDGESNKSSIKSVKTQSDTVFPATPRNFTITTINAITQSSVALKWTQNTESDLDHYNIYYGTTSGALTNSKQALHSDASSFTIDGLSGSTRYFFAITAVDTSDNESEKSDELVVDTLEDNLPPFVPVIRAEMSGQNEITVHLSDNNAGMVDYGGSIIYYGTTPGSHSQSVDVGKKNSFVIGNLSENNTWYISALAYDIRNNKSQKSSEISVKIEDTQSFLGQADDFEGGCFIHSMGNIRPNFILFYGIVMVLCLLAWRVGLKWAVIYMFGGVIMIGMLSPISHAEESYLSKKNMVGVSFGYYVPAESDFEDYYDDTVFPITVFYDRCIYSFMSADIETGYFKEDGNMRTVSGASTEIDSEFTMIPVSASIKFHKQIIPYIVGYIGFGPDYWYCREKTDQEVLEKETKEWVGGYHGKIGVKLYNMDKQFENTGAIIECGYAVVDKFGNNDINIGGLTLKVGLFYQF